MVWPILMPEESDLDENGRPVLRCSSVTTLCTDCLRVIKRGKPRALVDREVVCPECCTMYALH